jgi:hypothetical protein
MVWSPGNQVNIRQIERSQPERIAQKTNVLRRLEEFRGTLSIINARILECDKVLRSGPNSQGRYFLLWVTATIRAGATYKNGPKPLTKAEVEQIKSDLISEKSEVGRLLNRQEDVYLNLGGNSSSSGGGGVVAEVTAQAPPVTYSPIVIYNASAVKEAYFYTGMSFVNEADRDWWGRGATDKFDNSIWSGNTPGKVNDANDLWNKSLKSNSKGMIQTWKPPGGRASYVNPTDSNFTTLSSGQSIQRYGFQFLYNPTTIEMSYGGVADVDPGLQSSGTEEFLLTNASVFQSTIGIQVIINRMFDFQYINKNGIKRGEISDFYSGNVPTKQNLKDIYEKGTMYDIEYLLQTMFPFEPYKSQLRGKTSDIGFLGASPVELHLGNKLRYVAQINNINVNHVIFDNRMVPLFTTISIATNRIPDYQAVGTALGSTSSSPSTTSGSPPISTNPVVPGGGSLIGGIGIQ